MMSSDFRNVKTFFLCLLFGSSVALDLTLTLNNQTIDPLDFLIPTVHSQNDLCRNHSLLYRKELSKFTIWATDMFDSSSKFPNGVMTGSIYDTGNFDECINVHLPESIGFSGQHCMAHFKLRSLSPLAVKTGHVKEFDEYQNIFNITTWHKIARFAQDRSKQSRDELYFSFCLPSSCSHEDLEEALRQRIELMREALPFDLEVDVDRRNCQVERGFQFSRADFIYMGIVGAFFLFGAGCTLYHLITKLEGLESFRLPGKYHDVMKAFSFSHTIKKMATKTNNDDRIDCMNGMKVLSMFFIILGHRIMFFISSPLAYPPYIEKAYRRYEWILILNGPIIVDTFFTISGFLACYILLLQMNKRNSMVNVGMLYFHRVIRLTPAYAVVLGFYCTIFVQMGEGPFWNERINVEQERCLESWWANMLYVNNYVNLDNICMFQSWYLTCDTHFYLFVPFLAYMLWKKPKAGLMILGLLIGLSVVIPFIVILIKEEEPLLLLYMKFLRDPVKNHTFQNIYIPSHMRACSYLIGVLAGYFKYKIRTSGFKLPRKISYFCWIFGIIIVFLLYVTSFLFYQATIDILFAGLFGAMYHLLWSVCMAWLIIAVSEGYGCWIEPILTWRPLILLSRITYTAFLCHGAFQLYSAGTTRAPVHTGFFVIMTLSISDIVLSYVAGFLVSLVFEAPIIRLEKIFFARSLDNNRNTIENALDKKLKKELEIERFTPIEISRPGKIHY